MLPQTQIRHSWHTHLKNNIKRYDRDQPSEMLSLLRAQVGHISSICSGIQRRSTASVSFATWAVLGCRGASSPSDVEDLCLWIWALRLRFRSLPYVTDVAARSRSRSKRAASCPATGQVVRRRTTWVATQFVCSLAETVIAGTSPCQKCSFSQF